MSQHNIPFKDKIKTISFSPNPTSIFVNGSTGEKVETSYEKKELEREGQVFISPEERKQEIKNIQKHYKKKDKERLKTKMEKAAFKLFEKSNKK